MPTASTRRGSHCLGEPHEDPFWMDNIHRTVDFKYFFHHIYSQYDRPTDAQRTVYGVLDLENARFHPQTIYQTRRGKGPTFPIIFIIVSQILGK